VFNIYIYIYIMYTLFAHNVST